MQRVKMTTLNIVVMTVSMLLWLGLYALISV